jgi:hypothetical protein
MADKRNKPPIKYLRDANEQIFALKEYYPEYTEDCNRIILLIDLAIKKIKA